MASVVSSDTILLSRTPPGCGVDIRPALGGQSPVTRHDSISSLLGGNGSKLDLIRRQQAGELIHNRPQPQNLGPSAFTGTASRSTDLEPSANECLEFALPRPLAKSGPKNLPPVWQGTDDFLASKRLPIKHTQFDSSWNRVRQAELSQDAVATFAGLTRGKVTWSTLAAVNSWANARIRYVEDRDLYGRADYWATADTTLLRGAGDCEDIAIAKMQMLAAMGMPRSDMYLTIAKDLARNADHAVLVVKLDQSYWLLDNSTNDLLDARHSNYYRPIFSFRGGEKWLHGYTNVAEEPSPNQLAQTQFAVVTGVVQGITRTLANNGANRLQRSVIASSNALRIGLIR